MPFLEFGILNFNNVDQAKNKRLPTIDETQLEFTSCYVECGWVHYYP